MNVHGIENMSMAELDAELAAGGRFVVYEYCISVIFLTIKQPTSIYFLRAGEHGFGQGLPYVLISLLLGWWGIPWGFIYTPMAIITNLSGGRDVTWDVRSVLTPIQSAAFPP